MWNQEIDLWFINQRYNTTSLEQTNQGSNFLRGTFSSRHNLRTSIQYRQDGYPSILLKDDFSLRRYPP